MGSSKQFSIGDLVHRKGTNEEGRIVRIARIQNQTAYIVTTRTKASGHEIEALWRPEEIREIKNNTAKARNLRSL